MHEKADRIYCLLDCSRNAAYAFLSHHYLIALIIIGLLLLLGYNFFIVIDVRCKDQICITALCSLLQRNGEGYGGAGVRSKAGFGRTG